MTLSDLIDLLADIKAASKDPVATNPAVVSLVDRLHAFVVWVASHDRGMLLDVVLRASAWAAQSKFFR